jgi:sn-glycerol 3-phosphate transport system permease protein
MKGKRTSLKKVLEPYCWLLPAFALFIPFTFLPFLQTVYKSFFIVDSMGTLKRFVGFENYLYILKDETFVKAVINTLVYVILTVPVSKILGMLLALFIIFSTSCVNPS